MHKLKNANPIKEVLELGLASILVRLTQAVNSLQPLPSDSTW